VTGREPWHALPVERVFELLASSPGGLSTVEARRRAAQDGPNALPAEPGTSLLVLAARQFTSPLIIILSAAAALTFALGDYLDGAIILVVLSFNAVIGSFQEFRAERAVRALHSLLAPRSRVLRDGVEVTIESAGIVRGDVVLLESGARIPADLRLTSANRLSVDESLLTGESATVAKQVGPVAPESALADRLDMAYAGTVVASGRGAGVVVAIGQGTELGAIAGLVREAPPVETPLQRRMRGFSRFIAAAVAALGLAAFGLGVAHGEGPAEMFRVAVAMAVSAVPEGLPVAFTITFALGVRRMAARNAIVRSLPAVETLGSTTVIGSDKTGTLTENRMTVLALWTAGGGRSDVDRIEQPVSEGIRRLLAAGVLANEAQVTAEGGYTGDPTETALLQVAERFGIDAAAERRAWVVKQHLPFEPANQFSGGVFADDGGAVAIVKGAPERVLDMCAWMLAGAREAALDRPRAEAAAAALAAGGLRVLAMASGAVDGGGAGDGLADRRDLTLLGLVAMMDPPRDGVAEAIAACKAAGIRVVMITGDHAATALAIARLVGVASDDAVLTGPEIATLDEAGLAHACERVTVFARVAPEQKLRIVEALHRLGHVVAVTGDGVNDAPALKAADIGVAMGRSGTDVAREAADIVLADDNFVSIAAAVEEGRVTFDNIRKVAFFLISTGVAEVIAILTALLLGWPVPFLAVQILWLNLVTNGLQDIALAFEPGEPDVLRQPPRPPREGLLSRVLWERTLLAGLTMAAGTLFVFDWQMDRGESAEAARTAALTTMVLFQGFHLGNARVERQSAFRRSPLANPFLFVCTAGAVAVHIAAVYSPPGREAFQFEPLPLRTWLLLVPVAASVVAVVELHKLVRNPRAGSGSGRSVARP